MKTVFSVAATLIIMAGTPAFSSTCCSEGFKSIFNGEDLTGWTEANGWAVEDGLLKVAERGQDIWTRKEYENFELRFEFMMGPRANSGVFFRRNNLEVQLLDDYSSNHANLRAWQYTGALYNFAAPSERASKSAGEWQSMSIKLDGQNLTVTLNGTKIVEVDLDQLNGHPGLEPGAGRVGFQNYAGTLIKLKNIEIKEL